MLRKASSEGGNSGYGNWKAKHVGKAGGPATAAQEKPIPLAEIRSRNPDAARKASFAARQI